ncbi:thioredoxin family protein [bacterium]|nr:thioredoxin family protein [bacterium]
MALTYSKGMALGTELPFFNLPGVDGAQYTPDDFRDANVLVVVFTCNHCPYAIASEDRLITLQRDFRDRGVRFVLINPNDADRYPDDSFVRMADRAKDKQFPFPYLYDESQEVARSFDAACTPDIFVFDQARKLRYNGRIDDNWKEPASVTQEDLRTVLEDLLAGREISIEAVPSMGCSIKWKP